MEKEVLIYLKNVENGTNKIRIPKAAVEKLGKMFYMKVYKDKIILVPVKKG